MFLHNQCNTFKFGTFFEYITLNESTKDMLQYKNLFIFFIFLAAFQYAQAQQFRKVQNKAFDRGEKMTFRVAFNSALTGNITGGKATLEIKNENKTINNRNTYHVVGEGRTTGFIELFYKVNDRLETYMDQEGLFSWQFIRRTRENDYKKDELVNFRQTDRLAVSLSKIVKVPFHVQDIVSAFYFSRTIDISELKNGEYFTLPFYLDDSVYNSRVVLKGREKIKTKMGTFNCLALRPMVATGYTFDNPYPITIWVTDDEKRVPLLIESELSVGRARIELIEYTGTLSPVKHVKPKK